MKFHTIHYTECVFFTEIMKSPKNIKERVAQHRQAILENRMLFDRFFSENKWAQHRFHKKWGKNAQNSADLALLGVILKDHFTYSPRTNPIDIIFHFKRCYDNMIEEKVIS